MVVLARRVQPWYGLTWIREGEKKKKEKKDDCSAFQTNRCSTRPRMQPMLLHSTKRITRALILFSTGYRSCSFFFWGERELKTPLLRRSMRLLQYFYAISFIWSKRTKFRRLLVDNKRSKISDKIYINIASIIFQSWIIFFTIDIHFRYL